MITKKELVAVAKLAEELQVLHSQENGLRARILPTVRQIIKENLEVFARSKYDDLRWAADKVKRGYFGTDVRSTKLLSLIRSIIKWQQINYLKRQCLST